MVRGTIKAKTGSSPKTDLTFRIESKVKGGRFLLPELIDQLEALIKFLRSLTDDDTTFEVVSMHSGSLTTVLRPTRRTRLAVKAGEPRKYSYRKVGSVTKRADSTLNAIVRDIQLPRYADTYSLMQLRDLVDELDSVNYVGTLTANDASYRIDDLLRSHIDSSLGNERIAYASFTGTLGALNLHGRKWSFTIYPPAGPKRILCTFKKDDLETIRPLINEVVTVNGMGIYRSMTPFPVKIRMDQITQRQPARANVWTDLPEILETHWNEATESERQLFEHLEAARA